MMSCLKRLLLKWFEKFLELKSKELLLTGEIYAGQELRLRKMATKPVPVPTQEEDSLSQSTTLLSFNIDSSSNRPLKPTSTIIFIALVLVTCIALSVVVAFAFLFFSSSSNTSSSFSSSLKSTARPLKKLNKPVVLLISSDGFRFEYQFKTPTPNIHRLIQNGTEAENGVLAAAMADQIGRWRISRSKGQD
ncbi:hypothetical protein Q3G72_021220 [Acer saccharum]|nr:hypothetical protein Q3G72_021220 [Acer saccharum]